MANGVESGEGVGANSLLLMSGKSANEDEMEEGEILSDNPLSPDVDEVGHDIDLQDLLGELGLALDEVAEDLKNYDRETKLSLENEGSTLSTHTGQKNTSGEQETISTGAKDKLGETMKSATNTGKRETITGKSVWQPQEKGDVPCYEDAENIGLSLSSYKNSDTTSTASARDKVKRNTSRSSNQVQGKVDWYRRSTSHSDDEPRKSKSPHSEQKEIENHRTQKCSVSHSQDIKSHRNIKRSRSPSREREKHRKLMRKKSHSHYSESCSSVHTHGSPSECVARQRKTRSSRSSSVDTENFSRVSVKRDRSQSQDSPVQGKVKRKMSPVRDSTSSHRKHRSSRSPSRDKRGATLDRETVKQKVHAVNCTGPSLASVTPQTLTTLFSSVGKVTRICKSHNTIRVEFAEEESLMKALALSGMMLSGDQITVSLSYDKRLYVGNLHPEKIREADLRWIFGKYGDIRSVEIAKNVRTGDSLGFGFVDFYSLEAAKSAYHNEDGSRLDGRCLVLHLLHNIQGKINSVSNKRTGMEKQILQHLIAKEETMSSITSRSVNNFAPAPERSAMKPSPAHDRSSAEHSLTSDRLTEKLSSLLDKYDLRFPTIPDMSPRPTREEVTYWTVASAVVPDAQTLQPREPAHFKVHLTDVGEGIDVVCMPETCKIEGVLLDATLTTVQQGGLVVVLAMNRKASDLVLKPGCSLCKFLVYKGKVVEPTCDLPVVSVAGCADGTRTQGSRSHIMNGECMGGKKGLLKQLQGYRQSIALSGEPCQEGSIYAFQLGRHLTALLHCH